LIHYIAKPVKLLIKEWEYQTLAVAKAIVISRTVVERNEKELLF